MPDSLLVRVERLIRAGADRALELAERASGPVLMREAVRELERTAGQLRADREAADSKRRRAAQSQAEIKAKLAELSEHASYALSRSRDDLARAAVARQLDLEKELEEWASVAAQAKVEAASIDQALAEVIARRNQMRRELDAAEREQGRSQIQQPPESRVAKAVERAEEMFGRALAERCAASADSTELADIVAMRRHDAVEERLAQLKSVQESGNVRRLNQESRESELSGSAPPVPRQ